MTLTHVVIAVVSFDLGCCVTVIAVRHSVRLRRIIGVYLDARR